jgi:hypothetical protein
MLRETRESQGVGTTDLLERLVNAVDDVDELRAMALREGNGSLVVRAAMATQALVATLSERLGEGGDTEVVRLLRDGERLARAVGHLARTNPAAGRVVAQQLRTTGDEDTADALEAIANKATQILETKDS